MKFEEWLDTAFPDADARTRQDFFECFEAGRKVAFQEVYHHLGMVYGFHGYRWADEAVYSLQERFGL